MDRNLQQLEAIECLSSEISIIPKIFEEVEITNDIPKLIWKGFEQVEITDTPNILRVNNQLNISFNIKFAFGEKHILSQILSQIEYLQNIMDGTSYIFIADLIESYYKIQREIYEGHLKGNGSICFGIKEEFEHNKQITEWCIGNEIGDSIFSIHLALKNSFSDRQYECVLIDDGNDEGNINIKRNQYSLNWRIDEFSDFNATDWPLSLSVYNQRQWIPEFISNQFMFMLNQCVFNNIKENINEFNENISNDGNNMVKNMNEIFEDDKLYGNITIHSRAWEHFNIDRDFAVKSYS
eukprot:277225_1